MNSLYAISRYSFLYIYICAHIHVYTYIHTACDPLSWQGIKTSVCVHSCSPLSQGQRLLMSLSCISDRGILNCFTFLIENIDQKRADNWERFRLAISDVLFWLEGAEGGGGCCYLDRLQDAHTQHDTHTDAFNSIKEKLRSAGARDESGRGERRMDRWGAESQF